jgi:hypothetical protein
MSVYWVMLGYGAALTLALLLLFRFEPIAWIWHLLSLCAGFAIGLIPLAPPWNSPAGTLAIGSLVLFLIAWGAFAPIFRRFHYHAHS